MNTSLKVILTAIGIGLLASPVMAQPESTVRHAAISHAHGSAYYYVHRNRAAAGYYEENNHVPIDACAHSGFPQCSGGM
jgi:hypothetical protein